MNWYLKVVRDNYANFAGRARRQEFWMFVLVNIVINIILSIIGLALGKFGVYLSYLYSLAILIPTIAVGVRRLQDTGRSGWWMLLCLVPLVNLLVVYFWALEGDKGSNAYGSDPKA